MYPLATVHSITDGWTDRQTTVSCHTAFTSVRSAKTNYHYPQSRGTVRWTEVRA